MAMTATLQGALVKRKGKTILGPVTCDLLPEGITIVLGPNGAGKTTLLKVLHGVERLTEGTVRWNVSDEEAHTSQAYVFQSPIMLRRSVRQNLAYPLQLIRASKADIVRQTSHWAQRIGLADALDRPATRLSGGEKQKLALGRALIRKPKVLFLDEPCANLDGRATREIENVLQEAYRTGTRIIMTTHDLGQAKRLASDVIFLLKGQVHEQLPGSLFFDNPQTSEARAFLQGDIVE
ncbi:ATP-binding cassette domain-containing protein [Sulfitobacter sp. JBTF-M27]|uniref:ATP-binding cassette domain-containing protein n=1 Tax=Sulfitobacter sediminilitoris TaxID=2698830 RepID=A0A6P0CFV8_9RHOB|nr:ATP-binding cassette domain-containing protein [Sulfitobacter sediminilitoris]NEK23373.1 ATP-binding cassette domain-containing protein [Sulfitobacter sediminilitoris]